MIETSYGVRLIAEIVLMFIYGGLFGLLFVDNTLREESLKAS